MKKNVASQVIGVEMITAADGTAFAGTVTCLVTVDGGTQTASGGTGPTLEGNGFYTYLPTQAETNGDHIGFTFTGTGAIPATVQVYTEFPQTGDSFARLGAPAGASVSADVAAVKSDSAAILVDTADMQPKIGTPAGASVSADVAAVKVDTAAILVDTGTTLDARIPAALTAGGNMKSDALAVNGSTAAAANLALSAAGIIGGIVGATSLSTTTCSSDLTAYAADELIGRTIIFTGGTALGQASDITDYVVVAGVITFTAKPTAPVAGDTFVIV